MLPGELRGDVAIKMAIARSYWNVTDTVTWLFLSCRISCLPLECFHHAVPEEGKIVEIGCGHGVVTQYLARREKARRVIGYDPDKRRIPVAKEAAKKVPNIEYRENSFEAGAENNVAAVIIIGVLYLLDDVTCLSILSAARASLQPGGLLLLSDIFKNEKDWRYGFHTWRERWFQDRGFTQGQGLFFRPLDAWQDLVSQAGFKKIEPFKAPVPMHSVFNWICK